MAVELVCRILGRVEAFRGSVFVVIDGGCDDLSKLLTGECPRLIAHRPAISLQVLPFQNGFSLLIVFLLLFVRFERVQQIAFGEHEMRLGAGH